MKGEEKEGWMKGKRKGWMDGEKHGLKEGNKEYRREKYGWMEGRTKITDGKTCPRTNILLSQDSNAVAVISSSTWP